MAYQSGTATDYADLAQILKTFALANGWVSMRDTLAAGAGSRELILKGTGLAGTDEIYVGLQLVANAVADAYGWNLQGMTGYSAGDPFENQPGGLSQSLYGTTALSLWNQPIDYWLAVNGRRILLACKVSTVYAAMYLGFLLPYGTPGQYPYPLYVGGSNVGPNPTRWSDTTANHAHFCNATTAVIGYTTSNAKLRSPSGTWLNLQASGHFPYHVANNANILPTESGDYGLLPVIAFDASNTYGELEGVFSVTGFGNGSENTITVGLQDYLVVGNVFRTSPGNYLAMRLA